MLLPGVACLLALTYQMQLRNSPNQSSLHVHKSRSQNIKIPKQKVIPSSTAFFAPATSHCENQRPYSNNGQRLLSSLHENAGVHPNLVPLPAYSGFAGNPYGSLGTGFGVASSFQQLVIYGKGPMPAGMHMVPIVLPDGRIGYVLQQPGVQMPQPRPRRVDRNNRPSGPGRACNSSDDGNRGRRYRPY
ncbi:hypothetical protein NC651_000905 [Populus alba x Populus x berolinensis]|nr:hypothetical protein NC651_000905 [Populus alba x Populus x berolinensis]